jgi:hypothetical protein
MFPFHSLPETQGALALSIFLATFIYEDGATLLAATLSWDCLAWAPVSGGAQRNLVGSRNTYGLSHSPRPKAGLPGMDRWPWS